MFQIVKLNYIRSIVVMLILQTLLFTQYSVCMYKTVTTYVFYVRLFRIIDLNIDVFYPPAYLW